MLSHLYYSSFGTTIFKSYAVPNLLKKKKNKSKQKNKETVSLWINNKWSGFPSSNYLEYGSKIAYVRTTMSSKLLRKPARDYIIYVNVHWICVTSLGWSTTVFGRRLTVHTKHVSRYNRYIENISHNDRADTNGSKTWIGKNDRRHQPSQSSILL